MIRSTDLSERVPHIEVRVSGACTISCTHSAEKESPAMESPPRRRAGDQPAADRSLRIFDPQPTDVPEEPDAHRINHPVRTPQAIQQQLFAGMAAAHAESLQPLADAAASEVRETCSLAAFYARCMAAYRQQQLGAGKVAKGTLEKESYAVRTFDAWDRQQRPADWPASMTWEGLPVGYLTGPYLQKWADQLALAPGTVTGLWNHLRTVLNHAVALQVISKAPSAPTLPSGEGADDDDLCKTVFAIEQLGRLYDQLAAQLQLQTALVVGANVGPRSVDLFGLRWGQNVRLDAERPEVWYRAKKTGKKHWCPLAPVTAAHLQRLKSELLFADGGLVFPALTSGRAKDPEKSRAARRRTKDFKAAMKSVGLPLTGDYEKPFQVLRATCSTRLNVQKPGMGQFLLHGPPHDVNSQHYFNYVEPAREAVLALPQPAEFLRILS